MEKEVMLSVCIIVYNHEKFICEALDSVLSQRTNYLYEIIVGDDCSTDRTVDVIKQNYGEKVILFCNEGNLGLTKNMYNIFCKAKGKYILDMAGDDWLCDSEMFETMINFLENNTDYASASFFSQVCQEDGTFIRYDSSPRNIITLESYLQGIPTACYHGMMKNYWKEEKKDISYLYKSARNNEETPWWIYDLEKGSKAIIPRVMYSYRFVQRSGASNYNSRFNWNMSFNEWYSSIQYIEKEMKDTYNFKAYIVNKCAGFLNGYGICKKLFYFLQMLSTLSFSDSLIFIMHIPILFLGKGRLPMLYFRFYNVFVLKD